MSEVLKFKSEPRISDPPRDLEAEQGILGIILFDNSTTAALAEQFSPESFYEAVHARIFVSVLELIRMGRTADAVAVNHNLTHDDGLNSLGGIRYLADLVDHAPPASRAREYSEIVLELWRRRELCHLARSIEDNARGGQVSEETIANSEMRLIELNSTTTGISLVSASDSIERVTHQLENPRAAFGVKFGLSPIDDVTGGFMPGELWLVAARPGMGKSAVASTGALNIATRGRGPADEPLGAIEICSEMTVEQMMRRHIADWCYAKWGPAAPSYSLIRKRALSAQQLLMFREAATAIRELGTLKSLYRTGLTVPVLKSIVRRQKAAWLRQGIRLGVVTIDHMGLVLASGSAQKRSEAQGEVARDTKRIASELEVPVIALVQLSRKVEERDDCRPRLSDVRDSGEWEENADGVIGLYREAYYAQRETEPKRHDLKLAWEDRRSSKWVDAMFLKIREGEMQTVQLWADLPRNAIRGGIPDSAFLGSHVDLLDPDQALLHDTATLFE